ncbi:MAG: 50S ribosomal protein L18 [Patescibacteria group bacterium]|jgi:large subunit ribosomal protein L18
MSKMSRKIRIRAKVFGTSDRPRVVVFRSNKNLYLQAIDDDKGKTLASASTLKDKDLILTFVKILRAKKIKSVVFDRGGYKYHGQVKILAENLRKAGLEF